MSALAATASASAGPLLPQLELRAVSKRYVRHQDVAARIAAWLRAGPRAEAVIALDGVSLAIRQGEVMGLVGESGCGKTTLGRIAAGLTQPSSGTRLWQGAPVAAGTSERARREQLKLQMIFQDPYASLNPRMRIVDIVGEAPIAHGLISAHAKTEFVGLHLNRVGLDPTLMRRFPHQFSGGQRARIGIARALAVAPEFLVCDESVAALDVSIQAQVLNLFMELRARFNLTYLFISHDLGVIRHMSDRIAVMYLGRIVETGPAPAIFAAPNHPYTAALVAGIGTMQPGRRTFVPIAGEIPSPLAPPPGCHFHPRCPHAMPRCREAAPALREIAPARWSACHLNEAPA